MRRSSRPRCLPVKYWDFETPDYSKAYDISYSISLLSSYRKRRNATTSSLTENFDDIDVEHDGTNEPKAVGIQKRGNSSKASRGRGRKSHAEVSVPLPHIVSQVTNTKSVVNSTAPVKSSRPANGALHSSKVSKYLEAEQEIQKNGTTNEKTLNNNVKKTVSQKNHLLSNENRSQKISKLISTDSHDSGITDLDGSQEQGSTVPRAVETDTDIPDADFTNSRAQSLDISCSSEFGKDNSYAMHKRPPTFKGVLSSTVISVGDISPISARPIDNDSVESVFKVPKFVPGKFTKKNRLHEPTLNSIAEEHEVEFPPRSPQPSVSESIAKGSTPIRKSSLIRSRLLNLGVDWEEEGETNSQSDMQVSQSTQGTIGEDASRRNFETISQISNLTDATDATTQSMASGIRKSGRARIRTLEFWNFEKAEVTTLDNGERSVTYSKILGPGDVTRMSKTNVTRANESRATKRKLDIEAVSSVQPSQHHKRKKKTTGSASAVGVEFTDMQFYPWTTDDFKCYLARSFCNQELDTYAGFLFLEEGQMIWTTTKETSICVISGKGELTILSSPDEGSQIVLKESLKTVIPAGRKLKIEKEKSDSLLKLFLVLQKKTSVRGRVTDG